MQDFIYNRRIWRFSSLLIIHYLKQLTNKYNFKEEMKISLFFIFAADSRKTREQDINDLLDEIKHKVGIWAVIMAISN